MKPSKWGYNIDPKTRRFTKWPKKSRRNPVSLTEYWICVICAFVIGIGADRLFIVVNTIDPGLQFLVRMFG